MPAPGTHSGGSSGGAPGLNPAPSGGLGGSFGGWSSGSDPVAPPSNKAPKVDTSVGTFGVDVTTPAGLADSMAANVQSAQTYTQGLSAALFGVHKAGTDGENQGGLPIISDIGRAIGRVPVLGPAAGMVGEAGSAVLSPVVAGGSKGIELASIGASTLPLPLPGSSTTQTLHDQYAAIPDSPEKQAAQKAIDAATPNYRDHLMFDFANQYYKQVKGTDPEHPSVNPELLARATTLGDFLGQAGAAFGLTGRAGQRIVAGIGPEAHLDHLTRMDGIDQVARGIAVFSQGDKGMTDAEQMAWSHWKAGTWSIDQANDFLAASDQGISHDARLQMASGIALDPQVWGSVGSAALSKFGMAGLRLVANPEALTIGKPTFGQVIAKATTLSEREGDALYRATQMEANLRGVAVGDLPQTAWEHLATSAGGGLTAADAEELVLRAAQAGRSINPYNVLGQLEKSQKATALVRAIGGKVGAPLQMRYFGQAAKIVRSIIDPFHLMAGTSVARDAATGILSEAAPRIVDEAYGYLASAKVVHFMHDIKPGLGLDDAAGYAANLAREVATEDHIASQFAAAGLGEGGELARESLAHADVNAIADAALANAPKNLVERLKLKAISVLPPTWDEQTVHDLAMRMHASYTDLHGGSGPTSVEEWEKMLVGRSTDELNKLHGMTFQNLTSRLTDAVGKATQRVGEVAAADQKLSRLYLMTRGRLTTAGVSGILDRMTQNAANLPAQVEEMKLAQKTYPELRFIPFREVAPQDSVDDFVRWIEGELHNDRFPTQLLDSEIAGLPDEVQGVEKLVSGTYSLAYRPPDEGLMGLSRGADGRLARAYAPWVDRVSNATVKAHGTFASDHNVIGLPLLSVPGLGKAIDVIEAGVRTSKAMVQTEAISMRATQRFQQGAHEKFGMDAADSKKLIESIQNAAGIRQMTVRGLKASNMQEAIRGLLPRGTKMTAADILNLTLEAYEGDLRYVGLTQKFTGRAKVLFGKTGTNFAGQVSEDLYQKIRFQYNLVFQAQEKIEPWVLSAQRGVMPVFGTSMTEADRLAARVAQNLRDSGMMRSASVDQAEWSSYVVAGSDIKQVLARQNAPGFLAELRDVRGTKFVNMNRVAAESSAKQIRAVLDTNMPGYFDRLAEWDSIRMGHTVSDEEVVAHWLNEGGLTHGIEVPDVVEPGIGAKLFGEHIKVGEMMRPVDLGDLRGLDLNYWAGRLGVIDGDQRILTSEQELRDALANRESGVTVDTLREALLEHGAHATQAERVVTSLNFNYHTFVNNLTRRYNLTSAESRDIGDSLALMAAQRDMSPADYISQVFSPTISGGEEAAVGQLGTLVDVMRAGRQRQVPDLAVLGARMSGAGEPIATQDDLMRNLATVFSAHLDPSAKWTLLQEFRPELRQAILDGVIDTDMRTLDDMWAQGADHWLAQQLMHNTTEATITTDAAEYAARQHEFFSRPVANRTPTGRVIGPKVSGPLGEGLLALPDHLREPLVKDISEFSAIVPEVHVRYEVNDLLAFDPDGVPVGVDGLAGADGVTYRNGPVNRNQYAVHLDSGMFGQDSELAWNFRAEQHGRSMIAKTTWDSQFDREVARQSVFGAPYTATATPRGLVGHEQAHATDLFIHAPANNGPRFDALRAELANFEDSLAARQLSETAMMNKDEAHAELLAMAIDPNTDMEALTRRSALQPQPVDWDSLPPASDTEYWRDFPASQRPDFVPSGPDNIAAEVEKVRGMLIDANLLRPIEPGSADIQRASQVFGRWTTSVVGDGLKLGANSQYASLLRDIAHIPTHDAVPYNLTHGLMVQQVENAMVRGSEDAFRLNFFKQNRSWAERSLNHPFFGIYPASYMWGKIAPELARFMMTSPFGVKTGAASYVARDMAHQIAARQEFDPEFAKMMEGVDKSDIGWFLSYLLPALPWDVGAAAPAWTRDLAQQGLRNQALVDKGAPPKPVNLTTAIGKVGDYVSPLRQVDQLERPLNELGQDVFGSAKQQKANAAKSYVQPTDEHSAANLGDPLGDAMNSLQDLFSR